MKIDKVQDLLQYLTADERAEIDALLAKAPKWLPLPGPQTAAYESLADVTGYGGAAGGGKTDLACGLALTQHRVVGIFRENGTELTGVIDRLTAIIGTRDGFNGKDKIWRTVTPDGVTRQIELGSYPNVGDETKYQGRPHDLLVFDEAANHREAAVRFLMGWMRSTDPAQKRCRALLTFNPPTSAEGKWVLSYFAPWLDSKHPNPAKAGELRYFATISGTDFEVPDDKPFVLDKDGKTRLYDFDPDAHKPTDVIIPLSRTFIPSRVSDNPYLMGTSYVSVLQGLPEPLRSQMLSGDFSAGVQDDPWQVIPTAWVEAAQKRWVKPVKLAPMDSIGVDVARGGKDSTILARRHGMWFDQPLVHAGAETPDGPAVAGLTLAAMRDEAPIHIDVIGVGSSPYDFLRHAGQQVIGVNVSEKARGLDQSGRLQFFNQRSELWWRMREALDPANNTGICLPPDSRLLADLCAPTWCLSGITVKVASRDEILAKIGRSPDYGSAYILGLMDTPKRSILKAMMAANRSKKDYDPYA